VVLVLDIRDSSLAVHTFAPIVSKAFIAKRRLSPVVEDREGEKIVKELWALPRHPLLVVKEEEPLEL
jgi:hypothetical protein